MAKERLDIIIAADVKDAANQIKQFSAVVNSDMKKAGASVDTFTKGLSKGAANATPALTNLGRVIQDAPFGIIGIANNIDPLLSSLQQLGKQSGGAGGALKALGGALLGPAGIAIGVSAVTSALIAFGPQISKAIGGVSEFDQTLRNAAGEGAKAFAGASESFGNFVRIVNDGEASVTRQNDALKNANSALSAYGLEIGSISQLQKQGSAIGAIYAQIKQEEAKSSILAAKAAEEYAKGVALGIAIEQQDVLGTASALSVTDLIKTFFGGATAAGQFAVGISNAYSEASTKQKLYEKENEKTKLGIDALIKSLGQVPGVVEKTDKARAKSAEISRQNNDEEIIANTNRKATIALVSQETSGLLALSKAAEAAFLSKQKNNNIDKQKALGGALGPVGAVQRALDPAILQKQKEFQDQQNASIDSLATKTQNAQAAFDILAPSIDAVFGALASGEGVGKALADSFKQVVVQLVAAVAKALILQAILAAFTGGGNAAAGGGGFLKILTGALGFKAAGGPLFGGQPTIVGENGPELITSAGYGNVTPTSQMGGTLSAVVSGSDLLFILNQASANRRGNFG